MTPLIDALTLQLGYNATLVTLAAALFGAAAGGTGTFLFLRKRALVSDAVAHATLPGVALAFILLVAMGGDGRNLFALMLGSAVSAVIGLLAVEWLGRRTRLTEDAAIGAVLSVFFGFGVVLLTVIQTLGAGRQAGVEGFLLGQTAGMLRSDALLIVGGAVVAFLGVMLLRRPMTLVAFDPAHARASGLPVGAIDLAIMGLVTLVIVIGLKLVGLVLVVALLIIPPVSARFWTERADRMVLISTAIGAASGYVGTAISATAPALPTGAIIVLTGFSAFAASLLLAPARGIAAAAWRRRRFTVAVHRRQGLLAIASGEPIFDRMTLAVLRRDGLIRADGVVTEAGRAEAASARRDEARWLAARRLFEPEALKHQFDGVAPIETVFTDDEVARIDAELARLKGL